MPPNVVIYEHHLVTELCLSLEDCCYLRPPYPPPPAAAKKKHALNPFLHTVAAMVCDNVTTHQNVLDRSAYKVRFGRMRRLKIIIVARHSRTCPLFWCADDDTVFLLQLPFYRFAVYENPCRQTRAHLTSLRVISSHHRLDIFDSIRFPIALLPDLSDFFSAKQALASMVRVCCLALC